MRSGKYINQLKGELQYKAFMPNFLPFAIQSDDEFQLYFQGRTWHWVD